MSLEQRLSLIENSVKPLQSAPPSQAPEAVAPLTTSRSSLVIGIPAVSLLMSWLDYRIGSGLTGPHSNQLAWALWLLVAALLALWLAIYLQTTWRVAICVGIIRSLEKAVVMAYCWSQSDHIHLLVKLKSSDVWTQIFLPELYVFLSAFWLGQWLSKVWFTQGVDEDQHNFERRVRRLNALTTAMAPVLVFLASVLAVLIKK